MRGSQEGSNVEAGTRRSELSILRGPLVKITIFLYNIVKPFCTYNYCIVYVRTVKKGNQTLTAFFHTVICFCLAIFPIYSSFLH